MKKTALIIMLITLLSKVLGFGREIVLSYFFGASSISDAYIISLTIPSVIFGFIGVGIVTAYIPMQSRLLTESGEEVASKFTSNLVNIILVFVTVVLFVGLSFTESIVKLFALGFSEEVLNMTIRFTRVSLFAVYFTTLISIFSGYLQIKKNYIVPALVGFPLNIIIIMSILLASQGNYNFLSVGTLVATISQFILVIVFIKKANFKYSMYLNFKEPTIIKVLNMSIPVVIGTSVNQINILIDRTIASSLIVGGISALNYADKMNSFIQGLFTISIITVMYPLISTYAGMKNMDDFKRVIKESINVIIIFIVPMSIGAMTFSNQIIRLLFGRGAFDENAVKLTSTALFFYSIGMLGAGLREIFARGFYSLQDTKTPMINASLGVVLNIILNLTLSRFLGIGGLALATSISAIFTTVLLGFSFHKKIGSFGILQIIKTLLKTIFASFIMGAVAKVSFNHFIEVFSSNFSLLLSIIVGAALYFAIIYFMKIEDVDIVVKIFKKKINRINS